MEKLDFYTTGDTWRSHSISDNIGHLIEFSTDAMFSCVGFQLILK